MPLPSSPCERARCALEGRRTGCATLTREGGGRNFNAKVGHGELEDGRGRKGRGRGRGRAEEQTRTSLAGTQGGASPQTRAPMRMSPPFWSGRDDEKGGGAKGKERPLRHNGKGMELVWGGEGSSEPAVEWTAARSSSRPARTCVRWVPVGGVGQGQAAERRRHYVSRPALTPHRQQRGAGAVEGQSTAKPQLAAPKGGKGPQGLSEASGPVPRRARRRLGLPAPLRSGFRGGVRVFRTTI